MKILWIKRKFLSGLDSTTWIEMTRHLRVKGHDVRLVVNHLKGKPDFGLGSCIIYLPMATKPRPIWSISSLISFFFYTHFFTLLKKPDIVLTDSITVFLTLPLNLLKRIGLLETRFVFDLRTVPVDVSGFRRWFEGLKYRYTIRYAKRWYDGITAITPLLKRQISEEFGIKASKIGLWSSGVSLNMFNSARLERINEKPFPNGKFVVMYHGVLSPNRGLQETVHAINLVNEVAPDIVFFMLGDGPARGELEFLIKQMRLGNNVFLHEVVPYSEVPRYISSCDVGILPFPDINWWQVSSPIKLMEYLAMEKPVIATDIEAHRLVLGSVKCAFFVRSHNPGDISEGILKAYQNRERLREWGRYGRKIIEEGYTWEKQAMRLAAYLKDILKK